ncbi:MAG: DNA alkylation repair protein [Flavobacteriales bacterium]|jgi:3-methyladenine DNA glycosylase AlkD|nr:DNA alkylation repair protein [Flavobacteriales bacterium]MBK7114236.1 DNA alkylation repair protein [Flavobacteriales bacterium]MCC6911070.1 DNA alkylation repair protein [Flavobacteriales bacterium]HQW07338.1 DNA alkylation repair protein [Flavobacteriales bacterium]HQX99183.1 DNA alkylation repair protein [Flavobacteriales bacterium]
MEQLCGMDPWLTPLHRSFKQHADPMNATAMAAYMKGHFPYFGIKTPERRALMKEHMGIYGVPALNDLPAIVRKAFAYPEREMHQVGVDLLIKFAKILGPDHLPFVEEVITTKSWWDSVDTLAVHVAGAILKRNPKEITKWNRRWIESGNMWLNRTAIIFQLQWKIETDQGLLFANIERHATHPDFFIRKAIGWALRSLGGTDPSAVLAFVRSRKLSPLSEREATRKLK